MSNAITLTDSTFQNDVIDSEKPILVDFWAEWCGPCKLIAPELDKLAVELDGQIVVGKMDIDANANTPMSYGVMSIPTLLLFKGGEVKERIVGFQPKAQMQATIQKHLS